MNRFPTEEQEDFIIQYLEKNERISVTDQEFHEQFYQKFGGKRTETSFGAQPVHKAQKLLAKMCQDKTLDRSILGIPNAPAEGFPKWEYVYFLWGY